MVEQLQGAVVALRPIRPEDVEPLALLLADPLVTRHQLTPPPRSRDGLVEWTRLMRYRQAERTAFTFAVIVRGTGVFVGLGQLFRRAKTADTEWGWLVAPAFWGTGLFFDTCQVLARFAREELGATELIARASASNARANSALRKLGAEPMSAEGAVTVWRTNTSTLLEPAPRR